VTSSQPASVRNSAIGQIFVLGTARSGTTWLANLLGSHPSIAAVTAPEHHGVHESHVLDHTRYAIPGRIPCAEFGRRYAPEDYFLLTGLELTDVCSGTADVDAVDYFQLLMDAFARRNGASWWLEKTPKHTIYVDDLLDRFPSAKFVVIRRSARDTLVSQLGKYAKPGARRTVQVAEKGFRYESDMRALTRLQRVAPDRVISVLYEDLLSDSDRECSRILRELGIPEARLRSGFPASSSLVGGRGRPLSPWDQIVAAISVAVVRPLPFSLLVYIRRRRDRSQAHTVPKYSRTRRDGLPAQGP
jgi:hypothetical protein